MSSAAPHVVIINLAGQLSALPATSFQDLRAGVDAAYGSLITNPSYELVLCYSWSDTRLEVRSGPALSTFLQLHASGALGNTANSRRPQSAGLSRAAAGGAASLPTLDLMQTLKIVSIPTLHDIIGSTQQAVAVPPVPAEHVDDAGAAAAAPQRRKAAPPVTAAPVSAPADEGAPTVQAPAEKAAWIGRSDRPNSATARELLSTFRPSDPPELPQIRMLMRDGSGSALMTYNVREPPSLSQMRRFALSRFEEQLEDKLAEMRGTPQGKEAERRLGRAVVASDFLLGFWFEGCDLPIDMDDVSDEVLLRRAVEEFGVAFVLLYVDLPFVDLQPVTPDIITAVPPNVTPKGLQVNQTRLPTRDNVRQVVKQQQAQLSALRERVKQDKAEAAAA